MHPPTVCVAALIDMFRKGQIRSLAALSHFLHIATFFIDQEVSPDEVVAASPELEAEFCTKLIELQTIMQPLNADQYYSRPPNLITARSVFKDLLSALVELAASGQLASIIKSLVDLFSAKSAGPPATA